MVRLHCPPKRAVRRDACEQGVPRTNQRANSTVEGSDRCVLRRRSRAFGPFESARRSRRTSTRHLDRAASSRRGSDHSGISDGIPRRSPGDRRSLERFSKTCLYQWRSLAAATGIRPIRWRLGQSQGRSMTASTSLAEKQPSSRRHGFLRRVLRTTPPETDRCRRAQDRASHQSGSSAPLARPVGVRLAPKA